MLTSHSFLNSNNHMIHLESSNLGFNNFKKTAMHILHDFSYPLKSAKLVYLLYTLHSSNISMIFRPAGIK
ncbi:unnamed protein product [Moneuplotes crassus]|uniref:Uncharacterized protein n=1 Tax=Euplotes crassus TaxID=5936 RepID=A0AAD2D7N1_EUPCR|nr:unnamed protein product [Moneuplotes crassus]